MNLFSKSKPTPAATLADVVTRIQNVPTNLQAIHVTHKALCAHVAQLDAKLVAHAQGQPVSIFNQGMAYSTAYVMIREIPDLSQVRDAAEILERSAEFKQADALLAPLLIEHDLAVKAVEVERQAIADKTRALQDAEAAARAKAHEIADKDPALIAARAALSEHTAS